ncbi:hypothetical protein ACM26V_23430 [Salipaludibacillus sp. HK11]
MASEFGKEGSQEEVVSVLSAVQFHQKKFIMKGVKRRESVSWTSKK